MDAGRAVAALALAPSLGAVSCTRAAPALVHLGGGLRMYPRRAWTNALARGELAAEPEVLFLMVHHTAGTNSYPASEVPSILQRILDYHTGTVGWPDIAYNFLVDRYGGVWEGRQGSIDAPVRGDATGGSQGFDQLCCFIGNHQVEPPTDAAVEAMVSVLGWCAARYEIDPRPGHTVTFASRGSNLWPRGTTVTARTIEGHRRLSRTRCPGDLAFALLEHEIPTRVARALARFERAAPSVSNP